MPHITPYDRKPPVIPGDRHVQSKPCVFCGAAIQRPTANQRACAKSECRLQIKREWDAKARARQKRRSKA